MKHCAGCPSLPAHMKTKTGPLDELPCYSINGLSENEDDNIDDVEFDDDNNNNNNTSAGSSVPDVSDDLDSPDSPKNQIHREKIGEAFEWNKESEAREPSGNSFPSQEQGLPVSSTTPLKLKSSTTSLQRIEIIEEADFMNVMNKGGSGLSQPTLAANTNGSGGSTFVVPHEAEIIDLSTPSPSCRSVVGRKKRRVSSSVTHFIDLTNSPNFVQL